MLLTVPVYCSKQTDGSGGSGAVVDSAQLPGPVRATATVVLAVVVVGAVVVVDDLVVVVVIVPLEHW